MSGLCCGLWLHICLPPVWTGSAVRKVSWNRHECTCDVWTKLLYLTFVCLQNYWTSWFRHLRRLQLKQHLYGLRWTSRKWWFRFFGSSKVEPLYTCVLKIERKYGHLKICLLLSIPQSRVAQIFFGAVLLHIQPVWSSISGSYKSRHWSWNCTTHTSLFLMLKCGGQVVSGIY